MIILWTLAVSWMAITVWLAIPLVETKLFPNRPCPMCARNKRVAALLRRWADWLDINPHK